MTAFVVTGLSPTAPSNGWTLAHPEDAGPTIGNHLEDVSPDLKMNNGQCLVSRLIYLAQVDNSNWEKQRDPSMCTCLEVYMEISK